MRISFVHIFLSFALLLLSLSGKCQLQDAHKEDHIEVSLRLIGHELLLSVQDSTSRVLPIIWEDSIYGIEFESRFILSTEDLAAIVKRIAEKHQLAKRYIMEVQTMDSNEVVYSFESNQQVASDIIPCGGRNYPKDHYRILFKILEPYPTSEIQPKQLAKNNRWIFIVVGILALLVVCLILLKKRKTKQESGSKENLIKIGLYSFNQNTGELFFKNEKTQLTNKESELLYLLFQNKNTTIERDTILNEVWGDEGDYVGRTLDVFISKLRKKLEADESIKVSNVRGVGYKLIIEN